MDPALIPALFDAMAVAQRGSVGAAARRLNKTPSAVSQQIRHLSDALGVQLFERRGRGLALTRAGEQILPLVTRLFDEAGALFRTLGELSGKGSAVLRLAASDYLARPLLVPVLRELAKQGVPLHFEISTAHSEEALGRLERGEVELAIVSFSSKRPGLEMRPLLEQPFYWIMPKRGGKVRPLAESLREEPVLRLGAGSLGRTLLDRYLDQHGIRALSTIDVPSVSLLLAYATGGVGVGLVPGLSLERPLARVEIEIADIPAHPVQLVMRQGFRFDPVIEHFVARLLDEATRASARLAAL